MKRLVLAILVLLAGAGCERNSYKTFSHKYRVSFSCNVMEAPFNQTLTPGRFVSVCKSGTTLKTIDCDGHSTTIQMSAVQNGSFMLGLAGLIIGTPLFGNDEMTVWAYDLGCPQCDSHERRLTIETHGSATCSKCSGNWDLNNNGFAVNGKQRPLYRYPTILNSLNNTLTINN